MSLESHNKDRAEFNLPPLSAAEYKACLKGWSRSPHLETQSQQYAFESIETRQGSRCQRNIFAKSFEQAVEYLTKPKW